MMIVCIGCVAWSGFTILSGLATSPGMLAFARVGVGVGEAAFQAPAYALLAAYFPAEQRGKAFAVMGMAIYFGQLIGYAGGGVRNRDGRDAVDREDLRRDRAAFVHGAEQPFLQLLF